MAVIPVWQDIGQSSHQIASQIGKRYNQKATHTGTLDPMAEGVLVVLSGEDRFLKSDVTWSTKEYIFEVLLGISTDTHDLLGLITQQSNKRVEGIKAKVTDWTHQVSGKYLQTIPAFSARRINGTSSFDIAKQDISQLELKTEEVTINTLERVSVQEGKLISLLQDKVNAIRSIRGDFRQKNIYTQWRTLLDESEPQLHQTLRFKLNCSKRVYVRGLVRDLGEYLNIPAVTLSITRTKNGPFCAADCDLSTLHTALQG